jgi:CRISPR type IV-associated DEAD/DEAH-box helicase Csf4
MALIVTLVVPTQWLSLSIRDFDVKKVDQLWLKAAVRSLLVSQATAPEPIQFPTLATDGVSTTVNLSLPEPAGGIVLARAKVLKVSPGQYCKRLIGLAAMSQHAQLEPTIPDEAKPLADLIEVMRQGGHKNLSVRYEQAVHFSQLMNCLSNGSIGMCEAGTGTGKTMAMVSAAIFTAKEKQSRVLLTFPTIVLMFQAARAYRDMCAYIDDVPPLRVVLGRREFVSFDALQEVMNGPAEFDRDVVNKWIKGGARAPDNFGFADTRWLAASLYLLEPHIPLSETLIPEIVRADDPGYVAYHEAFRESRENGPELQLCTHAMLAYDMRSKMQLVGREETYKTLDKNYFRLLTLIKSQPDKVKKSALQVELNEVGVERALNFIDLTDEKGLLPSSRYLIIDEAHLFETNVSSALSEYVSMQGILHTLKAYKAEGGHVSERVLTDVKKILGDISSNSNASNSADLISLHGKTGADLLVHCRELSMAIGKLKAPSETASPMLLVSHLKLTRMLGILSTACKDRNSQSYLKFSPIKLFPQLYVGKSTVSSILAQLWNLQVAVAMVSATLYLRRQEGYSCSYQQMLLNIPATRIKEYVPVSPAWLFSTVEQVVLPPLSASGTPLLRPPTRSDRLTPEEHTKRENQWLDDVSVNLDSIYLSSPGGVLVLLTSFASATYLGKKLEHLSDALVVANEDGLTLQEQKNKFLYLSGKGVKPLWLAVGGAWTGLDVGGHSFEIPIPAKDDNVLTTLVIPRLPFGSNRTITHQYRMMKNPEIPWEMLEMAFRFKQGLGRPIRRDGLPANRRFYILDGRLNDPSFSKSLVNVMRTIEAYKKN